MGKIKTVVMGDLALEEAARKKAEAKREQKKLEKDKTKAKKEAQKEEEIVTEAISEELAGETTEKKEETGVKKEEEKTEKKKPTKKTAEKYVFPSGKKYLAAKTLVDNKKLYPIKEAIDLVKKTSYSKFDGSVEVHINLNRENLPAGRQDLRGNVTLPHSTGRSVRVVVATDDLINSINSNNSINFDVLVAAPEMMPKLAKIARILGPKGLMPNPKTNTISDKPEELVKTLSSSLSWKTQPDFPIIHSVIGKVSFDTKKLEENLAVLLKSIGRDRIISVFLKATMGPAVKLEA